MFHFFFFSLFSLPSRVLGPLGKFKSQFSIVSALRGLYITENESCQFYYRWSTAPLIKNKTSYTLASRCSHKIALLDQSVILTSPSHFLLQPLSFSYRSPLLMYKMQLQKCPPPLVLPLNVIKRPGRTSPQQARGSLLAAGAEIKSAWRFTSSRLPCQYPSPVQSTVILKSLSPSPSKTSFHITYI